MVLPKVIQEFRGSMREFVGEFPSFFGVQLSIFAKLMISIIVIEQTQHVGYCCL